MSTKRSGRRIIKWIGILISGCLLLALLLSFWLSMGIRIFSRNAQSSSFFHTIALEGGNLEVVIDGMDFRDNPEPSGIRIKKYSGPSTWLNFSFRQHPLLSLFVKIPIWFLLFLTATPTFFLWRSDRDYPRGHCQTCGYNLTGNTTGTCPECGEETETPEPQFCFPPHVHYASFFSSLFWTITFLDPPAKSHHPPEGVSTDSVSSTAPSPK